MDRGWRPGRPAVTRGHALRRQTTRDRRHRQLLLDEPREALADHGRLDLIDGNRAPVAIAGEVGVAICPCAREEAAGPGGVQLAAAATFLEGRALELGKQGVHLPHQALLRGAVEGAVDEVDGAPGALQLFDHHVLVGIVARQPVRGQDEHLVELTAPRGIAQALQTGSVEARAAIAIVQVAVLGREDQALLRGIGGQGGHLARYRPLPLLLGCRDAGIESSSEPPGTLGRPGGQRRDGRRASHGDTSNE
jgi:hypothetical protein